MSTTVIQIENYIAGIPEPKQSDLRRLDQRIRELNHSGELWFSDGKDETGKVVSNPNIGYGKYTIRYADGTTKEFFRIGISANSTGISVYVMGLKDKQHLRTAYGKAIGKAAVTGYCIKFRSLNDIHLNTLAEAIQFGFNASDEG